VRKVKERRFYVPEEFEQTLKTLEAILKREGKSLSAWFRDQAQEYVTRHESGNPQTRLDRSLDASRVPLCSRCGDPATRVYFTSGAHFFTCDAHKVSARSSPAIKGWRQL